MGLDSTLGNRQVVALLLLCLHMSGCAARKPAATVATVPRECISSVNLTEKSECYRLADGKLHCTGIQVNTKLGCEVVQVKKETK